MDNAKLYRLMDEIEEIKQLDELISKHYEYKSNENSLMLDQYLVKKDQLSAHFINELNAFSDAQSHNLRIIKLAMRGSTVTLQTKTLLEFQKMII